MHLRHICAVLLVLTPFTQHLSAQTPAKTAPVSYAPSELQDAGAIRSEMSPYIERFTADRGALLRKYPILMSTARKTRLDEFYRGWQSRLASMNFDGMSEEDKVDYLLFKNYLDHQLRQMDLDAKAVSEASPLLPFAETIVRLDESCRRMEAADGQKSAAALAGIVKQIASERKVLEQRLNDGPPNKNAGIRAARAMVNLRATLKHWFSFYDAYDPMFTWWVGDSYKTVDSALQSYETFLREKVGGAKPGEDATVSPIGREALMSELANEMIPYTPEELIAIANKEFAWCENEMKRASRDLGYGDDWKKALEHVKTQYVAPGKQPELIRQLALEAEKFMDDHDLITIPNLARETWRMEMMSPKRQLVESILHRR